ncbi:MAG: NTP transferase domain-containing protein [Firmicutes bacterium]|nr:NTP transferase domain-containing protein [Bacillota bacterium]MBR6236966.1 NTP transferase domain-containing protein [Bacillota bacterium]
MSYKVDNAIIMAAGTSSRFAPLSYEKPKALTEVKGEVLIERQIRQILDAGIKDVIIVTGYKKEQLEYLKQKFGVKLVENKEYLTRNNNSTINAVKNFLNNSYICSSDNYFAQDPFETVVDDSYYAAVYSDGPTQEWCLTEDADGYIDSVKIGGSDAWYMLGHTFWNEKFSRTFLSILEDIYDVPETAGKLWEAIYMEHLDVLKMKMRRYPADYIFEFDTLDELREFDNTYKNDTRSVIMKDIAARLGCAESGITGVSVYKTLDNSASGIYFDACGKRYRYDYDTNKLEEHK